MVVHDLHPDDLATGWRSRSTRCARSSRATAATSSCSSSTRPVGAVHLRLLGSCDGCPSSAVTLRTAVERAIAEAAPEIVVIDVEEPSADTVDAGCDDARRARTATGGGACGDRRPAVHAEVSDGVDPLRVLARIRRSRPGERPRPGERCEMCADARSPTSTITSSTWSSAASSAPAAAATCSSRPTGAGGSATAPSPTATCPSPTSQLSPGQWDEPADPGERGLLLPELDARAGGGLLPGPGRGHGVAAVPRHLGRGRGRQPGLATLLPDVEAFLVRSDRPGGASRVLPRAHRRLLRAGRAAPPAVAGLRRRPGGPRRAGGVLRRRPGAGRVPSPSRSPS